MLISLFGSCTLCTHAFLNILMFSLFQRFIAWKMAVENFISIAWDINCVSNWWRKFTKRVGDLTRKKTIRNNQSTLGTLIWRHFAIQTFNTGTIEIKRHAQECQTLNCKRVNNPATVHLELARIVYCIESVDTRYTSAHYVCIHTSYRQFVTASRE